MKSESEIRLEQVSLEEKLGITVSLCAWCYRIGRTKDRKLVYYTAEQAQMLKEYDGSHGICPICYDINVKELNKHIDYLLTERGNDGEISQKVQEM